MFFTLLLVCLFAFSFSCDLDNLNGDDDNGQSDDDDNSDDDELDAWGDDDEETKFYCGDGNETDDDTFDDDICDDDSYYDDDSYCDDDGYDDDSAGDDDDITDDDDDDATPPDLECPDYTTPTVLYLSADDSNSQAAPVVARAVIEQGGIVPADRIRTYEFTNYYDIRYTPPADKRINVVAQMRLREDAEYEHEYILQLVAQAHRVRFSDERPLNIVFCVDVSGSMSGTSIQLAKKVANVIAGKLKNGDIVSIVAWNHQTHIILESYAVEGPCDPFLLEKIASLYASGSTNLHDGLVAAYEIAGKHDSPWRLSRVVLISDGGLNTGITDLEIIAQHADDSEEEGIYLVGVGVGDPVYYYFDEVMDQVTDAGKGAYLFVDNLEEAERQFGWGFVRNMDIAALDVQLELTMPYYLIMHRFYGEEYSPVPEEVEPQHLGPNDAMVFHQYVVACEPGLMDTGDVISVTANYIDPFTYERKSDTHTDTIDELLQANADQLLKGDAIVTYAEALKQIDSLVYTNPAMALQVCQEADSKVRAAAELLQDQELIDIHHLLERYEQTLQHYID